MRPLLELVDLTKHFRTNWTFRTIRAVDHLSLSVEAGEVFGVIGHNGAGKTTTFKLLVGLLRPTAGAVLWDGVRLDWRKPRGSIGFAPEQPYFYDYLTVRETLDFYGQLYGLNATERRHRVVALATELQITHKMEAPIRTLSKGTLQRVAVAQAILSQPRLVILDEPMSGLDPTGRKHMRDLIVALKRNGTAVLFSSHILSDAEALCSRVAILAAGRLREVVSLDNDATAPTSYSLVCVGLSAQTLEALSRITGEAPLGGPRRWTIRCADQRAVRAALAALQNSEASVESVTPQRPSLEQRFLQHVGNGFIGD